MVVTFIAVSECQKKCGLILTVRNKHVAFSVISVYVLLTERHAQIGWDNFGNAFEIKLTKKLILSKKK